ncbi:hypothetical protein HpDR23_13870 [Helicobacter pylori]
MAHFIFSVAVVLLWLVAWGIYLVFGKNLKREMEEIENSDPNQNNPFITAAMGIGGEAFRKDKLTEGQKFQSLA